jgi:tetratricopeptide (TPR) repeat protein
VALHRQGDLRGAERIYTRVLKARRDHFDALHLLGLLKHQTGKAGEAYRLISAALASFEQALVLDPDHVEALNNRGTALLTLERPAEALATFERLLAISPRHLEAQVNRANALLALGRAEKPSRVASTRDPTPRES